MNKHLVERCLGLTTPCRTGYADCGWKHSQIKLFVPASPPGTDTAVPSKTSLLLVVPQNVEVLDVMNVVDVAKLEDCTVNRDVEGDDSFEIECDSTPPTVIPDLEIDAIVVSGVPNNVELDVSSMSLRDVCDISIGSISSGRAESCFCVWVCTGVGAGDCLDGTGVVVA